MAGCGVALCEPFLTMEVAREAVFVFGGIRLRTGQDDDAPVRGRGGISRLWIFPPMMNDRLRSGLDLAR